RRRHGDDGASLPAHPPERTNRGPYFRDRIPRSWRAGLLLHLRLTLPVGGNTVADPPGVPIPWSARSASPPCCAFRPLMPRRRLRQGKAISSSAISNSVPVRHCPSFASIIRLSARLIGTGTAMSTTPC